MNKSITTGNLYGSLSHGNHYEDFFQTHEVQNRKKIVLNDIKLAGINLKKFKNYSVMNVGTGRESLALSQIGAKSVFHYDISKQHISRFKKIKNLKYNNLKINSKNTDLCKNLLPINKFDFAYLNGIVHHFSNTAKGLLNCSNSIKINGLIWVYFYRSGTFKWFVLQMIRGLINKKDYNRFFLNISNIYGLGSKENILVSRIMDDFYAPYIHLYTYKNYAKFMENLGFSCVKEINSNSQKNIDHQNLHHSCILVFKKNKIIKNISQENLNILSPKNSVNQLDKKFYKNRKILQCINLYKKIHDKKNNNFDDNIISCVLALHQISAKQYYGGKELPPNYDQLINVLENTLINLK